MQYEKELGKHSGPGCVGGGKTMITPHIRFWFERWSVNKEQGAKRTGKAPGSPGSRRYGTETKTQNQKFNFNDPWEQGLQPREGGTVFRS